MKVQWLFGMAGVVALWWLVSGLRIINPMLLPPPDIVFIEIVHMIAMSEVLTDLSLTMGRILFAFTLSLVIGIPIGIVMGLAKPIANALEFPVEFFRAIPATALYPIFMILLGVGDTSKLALVIFSSSLVIIIYAWYGVKNCSVARLKVAKAMRLKGFQKFYRVILPDSLPNIMAGIRISLSIVLILVVVLEMFTGNTPGIGKRIFDSSQTFRIKEMYAIITIVGIIGFLLNKGLAYIEKKFVHWAGQ